MARKPPELSVVVIGYRMARELPRTLRSLSLAMQRGIKPDQYEIILIDNGSPAPMPLDSFAAYGAQVFRHRFETNSPSPAAAANFGLKQARGRLIGMMIDGARLASPGLLATALLAERLDERPVISSLGFHLGFTAQMEAVRNGYDQAREDALLDAAQWTDDGYRLFDIAALSGSSEGGFFLPVGESNALFLPRRLWRELGGLDERFESPGGGYVNLDLYRRACELPDTRLVVMLGEGTFHQVHGGVATNATVPDKHLEYHEEYMRLRGRPFDFPRRETLYLGQAPTPALRVIEQSARLAPRGRSPRDRLPAGFDAAWYLGRHPDVAAAGCDPGEHFLQHGQFEGRAWRP
ncbi:MAG TPA: glycosyltransferase family A protein [Stellaceae bacterium]|nr:glycosyltransferase family A protein [Stellaceae bacterium]